MTNTDKEHMQITFWGTRGTLPSPGPEFIRAGGNTNCVEVVCGKETIVFDGGTGIKMLGRKLIDTDQNQNVHLLLSHAHYDHVEGIPFFAPLFQPGRKVDISCGKLDGSEDTRDTVINLMRRPYFPVGLDVFVADVTYNDLGENDKFEIGPDIKIRTCPLNHPGGATGYRIDYKGKSFAYVTDTEHTPGQHDKTILDLIDGVDLFIYDCSFLDHELADYEGFGHSTHEEAIRLCELSEAGGFHATHHMPYRSDAELDAIEAHLYKENPAHNIAREGDTVVLK